MGSGLDTALFVFVGDSATAAPAVSSVAYAGVNLTKKYEYLFGAYKRSTMWYRVTPADGSNNVVVTLAANADELCAGSVSYFGVDQAVPLGTETKTDNTSTTALVTIASIVGYIVIDFVYCFWASGSPDSSQQSKWQQENIGASACGLCSTKNGASSVTMQWTRDSAGFNNDWTAVALSIKPAEGVPADVINPYLNDVLWSSVSAGTPFSSGSTFSIKQGAADTSAPPIRIYDINSLYNMRDALDKMINGWRP
jgi:hypothetical protein